MMLAGRCPSQDRGRVRGVGGLALAGLHSQSAGTGNPQILSGASTEGSQGVKLLSIEEGTRAVSYML